MIDRLLGSRFIVITRVGRTELGDSTVVIDVAEERAIRLITASGLVPELRHRRRVEQA